MARQHPTRLNFYENTNDYGHAFFAVWKALHRFSITKLGFNEMCN